ncbi:hypothetical protein NFI96_005207 [Prochilodus magdalenae]|nr:hypothetical protein NFI96_005207 [Prochilodus magdalenae]
MSYRGRVLIINNLVASTLWHRLAVLNPPAGLLADIQRRLVEFFWSGQHWLKAAVLYLPTHEGGQGLIDLESRVTAFRLKAVQRLLYRPDLPWRETAHVLLRKAGNMGLDRHLFLLDTTGLDLSGLESFYASMLSAWTLLQHTRVGGLQPTPWVWEEPIFCNKLIPLRSVLSTALRRRFLNAGLCKVGCLRMSDSTGWKTAGLLSQQTGIATQRLLGRLLDEVQQALPHQVLDLLDQPQGDTPPTFPPLHVTAADGGWQDGPGALLTSSSPSLGLFGGIDGEALCVVCVKVRHLKDLAEVSEHRWQKLLKDQTTAGYRWRVLYKLPLPKRSGDLQWQLIHRAIATNLHTSHFVQGVETGCPFCAQPETVQHLFTDCSRLNVLFGLLHGICSRLGTTFTFGLFILGPEYTFDRRFRSCLINFVFGQAKLAIWLTRRNRIRGHGLTEPDLLLKSLISARVKLDFAYFSSVTDLMTFETMWCVDGALCCVQDGELVVCV